MSIERRPQKFFNTEFARITQANYAPLEKVELSAEMGGFKGAIGERIAELQAEGLGRVIGIPAKKEDPNTRGAYQEKMYALSLTDEHVTGHDKRVLLVIPHDNGYDMAIVSPLIPPSNNIPKEAERIVRSFDKIFSPSERPFIFTGSWAPEPNERPVKTFVDRQKQFFAQYEPVPHKISFEEIFEEAINVARNRKQPQENEVTMLREIYNSKSSDEQEAA